MSAKPRGKTIEPRKANASPVCYLDDPEIDPAYNWAEPEAEEPVSSKDAEVRSSARLPTRGSSVVPEQSPGPRGESD